MDPRAAILAGDPSARAILVFDRLANGDAKPKRVISGRRNSAGIGVASGTKNNAIVASRAAGGPSGIFVFNRLDQGDVAPKRTIAGPMTGALGRFRQLSVDPSGEDHSRCRPSSQEPTPQRPPICIPTSPLQSWNRESRIEDSVRAARACRLPGRLHRRVEHQRRR